MLKSHVFRVKGPSGKIIIIIILQLLDTVITQPMVKGVLCCVSVEVEKKRREEEEEKEEDGKEKNLVKK